MMDDISDELHIRESEEFHISIGRDGEGYEYIGPATILIIGGKRIVEDDND